MPAGIAPVAPATAGPGGVPMDAAPQFGMPPSPLQPVPAPAAPGYGGNGQMPRAQYVQENDQPDAGDDVWIGRAKKAITETQNDPFRQVQLLQHLSVLYLKERYGRNVHADKGQ